MSSIKLILLGASAFGIAGCSTNTASTGGAGGPETISPSEAALQIFSDEDGDLGTAMTAGETVTARSVSVVGANLDYNTGDTSLANDTTVAVRRNANGELEFTLNGVLHEFTAADRVDCGGASDCGYQVEDGVNGIYYGLYNASGDLDEIQTAGNGWSAVVDFNSNQINAGGQPNRDGFAVIGTETQDAALAGLASATYSGRTRMNALPTTGFAGYNASRTRVRSDLTMTADFGAGEISGTMDNFTIQDPGEAETAVAGSIAMSAADFTQNAYSGTLSADAAWTAAGNPTLATGSYSGAFYGPDADVVSGVLSATGSDDGDGFIAYGYFEGNKD